MAGGPSRNTKVGGQGRDVKQESNTVWTEKVGIEEWTSLEGTEEEGGP